MAGRKNRRGFTLVEAVIAAVIIAALLAILIPVMRERERARLQALADAEPWEVFEFRAAPAKKVFAEGEDIVMECEIENLTRYPLALPGDLHSFYFTFGDTSSFAGSVRSMDLIPKTAIAPGASAKFGLRFHPIGVGGVELRLVYVKRVALLMANENASISISGTILEGNSQGSMALGRLRASFLAEGGTVRVLADRLDTAPGGGIEFTNLRGILPGDEKRFQSDVFQLLVEAGGDPDISTFDEIIEEIERLE